MARGSKSKAGGGIASNKLVHPAVRTGAGARGINPGAAGQIGSALATHVGVGGGREVRGAVEPAGAPKPYSTQFGNAVALNVGRGGPGAGRTVHSSGSQGQHGPVERGEPRAGARDILGEFGPERRR
jgi:hypothetical protein